MTILILQRFFQENVRYQFWTKVIPYYTNARDTIMDMFLFGKYCDIFPHKNISDELSNVYTYPDDWLFVYCRRGSTITAHGTIDSSDYLFPLSFNRTLMGITGLLYFTITFKWTSDYVIEVFDVRIIHLLNICRIFFLSWWGIILLIKINIG